MALLHLRCIQVHKELIIQLELILSRVSQHILQFNLIFTQLSQFNTLYNSGDKDTNNISLFKETTTYFSLNATINDTKKPPIYFYIEGFKKKGSYLLSHKRSTIGVTRLNFSVRNGKRWNPCAIAT